MRPALVVLAILAVPAPSPLGGDAAYEKIEARYVHEFLRRNPVVSTYLGGAGLDPTLAEAEGRLRDFSPEALADEARMLREVQDALNRLDPATLRPPHQVDREVALHQIAFQLHQNQERRYWQRALDTYVNEPFRGVDWAIQAMSEGAGGRRGTESEWRMVAARVGAVPRYLAQARTNLEAGLKADNVPDWRMVERDGLASTEEDARYFEAVLPGLAVSGTRGAAFAGRVVDDLRARGLEAARAYRELRAFLERSLATLPKRDRFALGEAEYDWALRNNLHVETSARELYEGSWAVVEKTRDALAEAARRVAEAERLELPWDPDRRMASTRKVIDRLAEDAPRSDAEMVRSYQETCSRLVEFGRRHELFDIPADYRLEVTATPPALESSIDGAAYYPAPPFKPGGVGRFYVSPTGGDVEKLKQNNRASLADLAAHEGFPGHDWHYKVMTRYRDTIGPVRWLTPGEVEGSSSMWEDSMAGEGWGLYAEQLMAEPAPGASEGFYTPAERLYQLQGELYRDLRVRVDTGIHTGRLSFAAAVDLFSEVVDFLPGSCADDDVSPEKKASCEAAERAIFRYSKWPTQAITYRLGKHRILALRDRALALVPGPQGRKRFHLLFMQEGTIPPDYFADQLLARMKP